MEGVEAVEVEKLYAFVRAFFGTHLLSSSCFTNLSHASVILFCPLSFAQSRKICKILSKFSKLSAILKHGGNDINRASVL